MDTSAKAYHLAADAIRSADAILIGAGAGMGVDSGLPDFRGPQGFWRAYPVFQGQRFEEISNPIWFREDPAQAWGFFGHRLHLYRDSTPHDGFCSLLRWAEQCPQGYFVFTSNVDGQFQKAGFPADKIVECHGSIHQLQCELPCSTAIWSATETTIQFDPHTIRATPPWPRCPRCNRIARPNVLMFNDYHWVHDRTTEQLARYHAWLATLKDKRIIVIELGCGTAIPTVRYECERRATLLIRCNPRDTSAPGGSIVLPTGALEAIQGISQAM